MKKITLTALRSVTAAQFTAASGVFDSQGARAFGLEDVKEVLLGLRVTAADRTNGNETYDIYVTSYITLPSGTKLWWDIAHFPQLTATGSYTMICKGQPAYPQTITTAGPGVAAVQTASNSVGTAGSGQGIRTLTAGMALHGLLGEGIAYSLVGGGTTPGTFTFELQAIVKA